MRGCSSHLIKSSRPTPSRAGFSDPGWCLKGHVVYLLEGELESEYEDGISSRRAGEAYIIPAGVKHRSRNPHAAPAVLLIVDEAG